MSESLKGVLYDFVGVGCKVFNDFTPKNTIDQVVALIRDIRDRQFEGAHVIIRRRLEAKLSTAKSTHSILSKVRDKDDGEVQKYQQNIKTLEKLLSYQKSKRDVDAGSFSKDDDVGNEWQIAEEHPSTFDFFTQKLKDAVGVLFEDQEHYEETIALRTLVKHQRDCLEELRKDLKPEIREAFDQHFEALLFASDAFNKSDPAKSSKKKSTADKDETPVTQTRIEIPID